MRLIFYLVSILLRGSCGSDSRKSQAIHAGGGERTRINLEPLSDELVRVEYAASCSKVYHVARRRCVDPIMPDNLIVGLSARHERLPRKVCNP